MADRYNSAFLRGTLSKKHLLGLEHFQNIGLLSARIIEQDFSCV